MKKGWAGDGLETEVEILIQHLLATFSEMLIKRLHLAETQYPFRNIRRWLSKRYASPHLNHLSLAQFSRHTEMKSLEPALSR